MNIKKVFFIVYYYPFDRSPCLQDLVRDLMSTHDISVLVDHRFVRNIPGDINQIIESTQAALPSKKLMFMRDTRLKKFLKRWLPSKIKQLITCLLIFRNYTLPLPKFCLFIRKRHPSRITIAADKGSLFAALLAGKVPELYYSLEVSTFWDEPSLLYKVLHIIEQLYVKFANPYVISQSCERINILQKNKDRQIIIPVTSSGDTIVKKDYLRQTLGISTDKKILLLAGGLGYDQLTLEIIDQVKNWEDRYVLVLHSAHGHYGSEIYSKVNEKVNKGRVFLSIQNFNIKDVEELIYASADIGIVLYRDLGFNYQHTAYASGKLAAFLRAGVPMIVPQFNEFRELLKKYSLGELSELESISEKANLIFSQYEKYEAEAYSAYNNIYKYSNYAGKVAEIINSKIFQNFS